MVERATRDLMAAEFGLGGYEPGQQKEIFDLFRQLRLAAGDFIPPEASRAPEAAAAVPRPRRPDPEKPCAPGARTPRGG